MDSQAWNQLVHKHAPPFGAFLQAWEWGEFQESLGRKIERIAEGEQVIAQAVQIELPFGQYYWYVPKGPLGSGDMQAKIEILREAFGDAVMLRIEPTEHPKFVQVQDMQPAHTQILDLTKGEERLLKDMKSKTRYNIRLAERKGVETRIVGLEHFEDFTRLLQQTTTRDKFSGHEERYYKKMLEALDGTGDVRVFLAMAFFEDHPIAGNIMIDFGDTRTYLHGASSNLHRNVMGPHALHMYLIRDAIEKGFKRFDLWGVAPEGAGASHPWFGITRYKTGWGGDAVSMPGTFDLPVKHMWYSAYRMVKTMRKLKIK